MADTDGLPGGQGPAAGCLAGTFDDRFAFFSNFGAAVDLAALGVCVASTWPDDYTFRLSGTSKASPHVAGAAALYGRGRAAARPLGDHGRHVATSLRRRLAGCGRRRAGRSAPWLHAVVTRLPERAGRRVGGRARRGGCS
jgi:hypothetical protein